MSKEHTKLFNKQIMAQVKAIENELNKRKKDNKSQKIGSLEKDFIRELKLKKEYEIRMQKGTGDINSNGWNDQINPFKEDLINAYRICKNKYYQEIYVDILVNEYIEDLIKKHKDKMDNGDLSYLWDIAFMNKLSIENSLSFLVNYFSHEEFLNQYYKEADGTPLEVSTKEKKLDSKMALQLTKLKASEHKILWDALRENDLFINNKQFRPLKEFATPFTLLTGFSGAQYIKKKGNKNLEEVKNVIARLKEVTNYLEEFL